MQDSKRRIRLIWEPLARLSETRIFVWLGGISLFLLVFLTPPFQVPDEPQHFYRSYQLSQLEVWQPLKDGVAGTDLPASLPELVQHFMGTTVLHTKRVVPIQPFTDTLKELQRPLDADRTVVVDMSGVQSYAPLPYIPQALGIAVGRALGVGPLGLMYLGRLSNAVFAALITAVAISLFPVGRTFALLVALLPMTQFLMASLSPDAMTIASSLLFTALLARFYVDGKWPIRRQLVAFVSGLMMCVVKVVYLPLLFAGLGAMLGAGRFSNLGLRRAMWLQLGAAALTTALIGLWFWSIPVHTGAPGPPVREGVDSAGQIAYLAQDAFRALRIVVRSVIVHAGFLGQSTVGFLGWLNVPLATWTYALLAMAFPLSACAEPRAPRLGILAVGWLALVAFAVVPPVELALYVGWTPVGAYAAEGVQGRYFIPALPMLGVAVTALVASRLPSGFSRPAYWSVVAILVVTTITMHLTIMRGYGLFPT